MQIMRELSPYSKRRGSLAQAAGEDPLAGARLADVDEPSSLRAYWTLVRKHRRKIALCVGGAVLGALVIVFSMTPLYTARTTLLIERHGPKVVNVQQVLSETVESASDLDYYQSQYEILKSRSLVAEVIKAQGLDTDPAFTGEGRPKSMLERINGMWAGVMYWLSSRGESEGTGDADAVDPELLNAYQGMLDVQPIRRSRLVQVSISSPSPGLSARIANAHAQAYIHHGMTLKSRANEEAHKFLEGKLEELKQRVEESEASLNLFRRGKGIISLDDKENIVVERLADLNRRLTEAEAERIGLEAQARQIKQREFDSLPAVVANPLIQNLKSQIVQLEAQHANLATQFLPGYPELAQLSAQLKEARQKLGAQIKSVVESINSAYLAAAGKERQLRVEMNSQKEEALALKDAAVDYAILEREAKTNAQLYDSVRERMQEVGLVAQIPASNVTVVDKAEVPLRPSKPLKRLNVMLAGALGLMMGLGFALVSEHLDNTLRTPEDVERHLKLPTLAVVPDFFNLPKLNRRKNPAPGSQESTAGSGLYTSGRQPEVPANVGASLVTEAYRKLRTAIFFSRPEKPPQSILFASASSGEGKTVSVINSAILFAQLENQVLVVDADLRRPSCDKALRTSAGAGLTDVLTGQARLDEAIKATSVPNLHVLGAGTRPPNPSELIGSKKMRELLALLHERYDFILIDSPPIMPVSDAVVLSTLVEGVVFVVRSQATPAPIAQAALRQLVTEQTSLIGAVLNRVDLGSAEYQDYYHYYCDEYYAPVRVA
jgi:polysaccharide biosynthesis transport protein